MIKTFKSKALKKFWERDDERGLRPDWVARIGRQLDALDVATRPEDLDIFGYGFHALKGDRAGRFAINVSRNWRITFSFEGEDATDIDLEDYHGN
ncbi:type II toxin-antitoxin system RelE/ParE family toxin [Pseudochelatococcus sp. G4_1912]|uniref:type II toxin-antitoxin system RelE/ParE family toxin n=1 Tax=Pseudochelatococcus sp. G4_1912 TaxID=3114288 RepID=UPI0039C63870